jgi:hypothetical protein
LAFHYSPPRSIGFVEVKPSLENVSSDNLFFPPEYNGISSFWQPSNCAADLVLYSAFFLLISKTTGFAASGQAEVDTSGSSSHGG